MFIQEVKVNSPDYRDMENEKALSDFLQRISHYEDQYESMCEQAEAHYSFMKIFNTVDILNCITLQCKVLEYWIFLTG